MSARPLRILTLGDSITRDVTGSYRLELERLLALRGVSHEFVGSQVDSLGFHHEGYDGRRATEAAAELGDILTASEPDLVLVLFGANTEQPDDFARAMRRIVALVARWRATSIVGSVLVQPAQQEAIDAENAEIVKLAKERPARTLFAPMTSVEASQLRDGVHPNEAGHRAIARAFDAAIGRYLDRGGRLARALGALGLAAGVAWASLRYLRRAR